VAGLPPPSDDAPWDWRLVRLDRAIEGIAARVPMNAAQAELAGLIVVVEGLALNMVSRAGRRDWSCVRRCGWCGWRMR